MRDPDAFLLRSILLRLGDIIEMWRDGVWLRTHITAGLRLDDGEPAPASTPIAIRRSRWSVGWCPSSRC